MKYYEGADGIKTGYLAVEKYSLASSIFKNNRRLIAVGSGFKTMKSRSNESKKLFNDDTIYIEKFLTNGIWILQ